MAPILTQASLPASVILTEAGIRFDSSGRLLIIDPVVNNFIRDTLEEKDKVIIARRPGPTNMNCALCEADAFCGIPGKRTGHPGHEQTLIFT